MNNDLKKFKTFKGSIYNNCPDIDFIINFIDEHNQKFEPEEFIEIKERLERVRRINEALRECATIQSSVDLPPYTFLAIIKNIKIKVQDKPDIISIINEVLETYKYI